MKGKNPMEDFLAVIMDVEPMDDPMKPGMHGDTEQEGCAPGSAEELLVCIKKMIAEYFEGNGAQPSEEEQRKKAPKRDKPEEKDGKPKEGNPFADEEEE